MERLKILRIDEPDFGCEGLPDEATPMCSVILQKKDGTRTTMEIADALLYARNLNEGDWVILTGDGLKKEETI